MLDRVKTESELKEFLVNDLLVELEPEEINADMSLGNDLSVDSLGFTELMAHVEDMYDIKISDEDFIPENFKSLNAVMDLIQRKMNVAI